VKVFLRWTVIYQAPLNFLINPSLLSAILLSLTVIVAGMRMWCGASVPVQRNSYAPTCNRLECIYEGVGGLK
jgi:hypothetical protein